MQLRKKKYITTTQKKKGLHTKNHLSMDIPSKNLKHNNQSLYLNKVLQKNLGIEATDSNFPNFKENITNFHSNLQNILSNEERRQKAMKYVIDMRNRKIQVSPALDKNNHTRNVDLNDDYNNNNAFSKTINDSQVSGSSTMLSEIQSKPNPKFPLSFEISFIAPKFLVVL